MKTNHHTKKSLKASGLALLACIVMLIGTTFAWFTDSITNTGNKIEAGSLDIGAMAYNIGTGGMEVTIPGVNENKEITFNAVGVNLEEENAPAIIDDELWEPGKTNAKLLKVENKGSLAAKIKLCFNVEKKTLEEFLWFDFIQLGEKNEVIGKFTKRPMSELSNLADGVEVKLESGKNVRFVLVYGMDEFVGNEAQKKTFSADVTIVATQLNKETDGFGSPDYDKDAEYAISTTSGLSDAIENAQEGDTVKIAAGSFDLGGKLAKGISIVGESAEKTTLVTTDKGYSLTAENTTIKNVTIDGTAAKNTGYGAGAVSINADKTTIENAVINGGGQGTWGSSVAINLKKGQKAYLKNTKISGGFRGVFLGSQAGGVEIDGCDIDATYPISVDGGADIISVKNSNLCGWTSYAEVDKVEFINTCFKRSTSGYAYIRPYSDTRFDNCIFSDGFKVGVGKAGIKYTFSNCYSGETKLTADNIQNYLMDMEEQPMKDCTVVVDGINVNWNK